MFSAALFTIARTWKQSRCSLTDEWIKKLWHIYTMEYYSAIKRNEFDSVVVRWINLEPVIHSKESQKEKNKYYILMHIYGTQKNSPDEPIYREEMEIQMQRMDLRTQQGKERLGEIEKKALTYIQYHMKNK